MILRPSDLEICDIWISFNLQVFESLEIDLTHVNKGGRSNFTKGEVKMICINIVEGLNLFPSAEKAFGDEYCTYYVRIGVIENKKYKLVFCVCSDRPKSIGVITLHRV